jgi:hypothetical protein
MKTLKDKIAVFQRGARQCFETDGHVCPVFAYAAGGEIKIVATQFSGAEDKDQFAKFMVDVIREEGVMEYLTVVEAWIASQGDVNAAEAQGETYKSLSDMPGREEAVVIVYCTPTTETTCIAKIDRSGGAAVLGEWASSERTVKAMGVADGGGRFVGLFARAAGNTN